VNQRDSSTWFGSGPPTEVAHRVEQVEDVEAVNVWMVPSPTSAVPAIRMPAIIRRRGPNRSTIHPAAKPSSGPTTSLLSALPEVTLRARPTEVAHHEIVEERKPVQRDPNDREKRQERRRRDLELGSFVRWGGRQFSVVRHRASG
jgi:hypothetical protein